MRTEQVPDVLGLGCEGMSCQLLFLREEVPFVSGELIFLELGWSHTWVLLSQRHVAVCWISPALYEERVGRMTFPRQHRCLGKPGQFKWVQVTGPCSTRGSLEETVTIVRTMDVVLYLPRILFLSFSQRQPCWFLYPDHPASSEFFKMICLVSMQGLASAGTDNS